MSQYESDPALHMTGLWSSLPGITRQHILDTQSDVAKTRADAWRILLNTGDVTIQALALDLLIVTRAASRMGTGPSLDAAMIRQVAWQVLSAPARDGQDRSGSPVLAATHVVALLSLAATASSDDIAKLADLAPAPAQNTSFVFAWLLAAKEVLRQVSDEKALLLAASLASIALGSDADEQDRVQAVLALAASTSSAIEPYLHAMLAATSVGVRIEAAAELAARNALMDDEYEIVRQLLRDKVNSPSMRLREAQLRAVLQQKEATQTE